MLPNERCIPAIGRLASEVKLMPQPPLHGPARITRPTLAKASVSGSIRVESGLLEGWVSWVTSIHFHCYGCES
jgi:hypothetical protein